MKRFIHLCFLIAIFFAFNPGPSLFHTEPSQFSGTLKELSSHTFVVQSLDGQTISFHWAAGGNLTPEAEGLALGEDITVFYQPSKQGDGLPLAVRAVVRLAPPAAPATELERARQLLQGMTLEQKVGQLFLVRHPKQRALAWADKYQIGGYLLFAPDFQNQTPESIQALLRSYQNAVPIPLLIGVDEEGGDITRISRFPAFRSQPFGSPQETFYAYGWEGIKAEAKEKAAFLKALGINLNLAPVCDVSTDPSDYIYSRAFGQDATATAQFTSTVTAAFEGSGVGCVLKHFPGYGGNQDTHNGICVDQRPYEQFANSDFLPFQAGIEAGAGAILVSHNIVACMDPQAPASLSPAVHKILREDLGFDGVCITDDLSMEAILDYTGAQQAAVQAILAGNDLLCCTDFQTQIPAVLTAVRDGSIPLSRIDESVLRVLRWKIELGILL